MKTAFFPLILIICLSLLQASAQTSTIQTNLDTLSNHPVERVFLHIDRNIYSPGDHIWYKAYLWDDFTFLPSETSNNLHVEVISPNGEIVSSNINFIQNGTAQGDFQLADTIPSGNYTIRAYTNFMRNFDNLLFFSQEISVLNFEGEIPSPLAKTVENNIDLQFMPEGGNFIENVPSCIAFIATDPNGGPVNFEANLYNSKDQKIMDFRSFNDGMGYIQLKAAPDEKFYAKLTNPASDKKYWLPKPEKHGIYLASSHIWTNDIELSLSANPTTFKPSEFDILVSSRGMQVLSKEIKMKDPVFKLKLKKEGFPIGISTVTILDETGTPVAERLVYNPPSEGLNISVSTEKTQYGNREKIVFNIKTENKKGEPVQANLSMAVIDQIGINKEKLDNDIYSYFFLNSNFKGKVYKPQQYFTDQNRQTLQKLDMVLLTHGWRKYIWKEITSSNKLLEMKYSPEKGFSFAGDVQKLVGKKSITDGKVTLATVDDQLLFLATETDSSGHFEFNNVLLNDTTDILIQAYNKNDKRKSVIKLEDFEYKPAPVKVQPFTNYILKDLESSTEFQDIARQRSVIRELFEKKNHILLDEIEVKGFKPTHMDNHQRLYSQPSATVDFKDLDGFYLDIPSALRAKLPGVVVKGQCPDISISIRGSHISFNPTSSGNPLLIWNGMPIHDFSVICDIYPEDVDKVEILTASRAAIYGSEGANGVIVIFSKSKEELAKNIILYGIEKIKPKAYQRIREFYSPDHSVDDEIYGYKDIRTTIYWEPNIVTDTTGNAQVSYYSSDRQTNYINLIQGISIDGMPGVSISETEISNHLTSRNHGAN